MNGMGSRWILGIALVLASGAASGAALDGAEILAGAEERIAAHRMGDVTLRLRGPDGEALAAGTKVRITQTKHAFLFGSNCYWLFSSSLDEPRFASEPEKARLYEQYFTDIFNYATTPLYWTTYERERGKPRHDVTAASIAWGEKHGITIKGHPLAWNNYGQPGWLRGASPKEVMEAQLARVERELTRFPGLIWDVINETAAYDREEAKRRGPEMTEAMRVVGPAAYTRQMHLAARKADPTAVLLTNDYVLNEKYKAHGIEPLVAEDLFDAIGMQSHMHGGTWSAEKTWAACESFKGYGKPLHFTEVTITSGALDGQRKKRQDRNFEWVTTPEHEARQAKEVAEFYTVLFSHPAVEAITWWDFSDDRAWQDAPAGFLRRDMTPKPAYEALKGLIKGKWWTEETVTVGEGGTAKVRGFYGAYEVTVETGDRALGGMFELVKDGKAEVQVPLE